MSEPSSSQVPSINIITTAPCPECLAPLQFRIQPNIGKLMQCRHCDEILIVRSIHPITLDWAFEEPNS